MINEFMRSLSHSQRYISVLAAFLIFAIASWTTGGPTARAEYACGTYSSGEYSVGSAGAGQDCPVDTTTNTPGVSSPSSSSTSATKNGSPSASAASVTDTPLQGSASVTLNDYSAYTSGRGQSIVMKVGDIVYLTVGSESHTIKVALITLNSTIITIASTPVDVSIALGQSVNYDIDKDGTNDITIKSTSVSAETGTSTLVFSTYSPTTGTVSAAMETSATKVPFRYWSAIIATAILAAGVVTFLIRKRFGSKSPKA